VRKFLIRLGKLDRRWIFLFIALAVLIPLLVHYDASMPASPIVQAIFDKIESLPAGSYVLISYDFGPATIPENQPMADALVRHCMERNLKVVMIALWATGPPQIEATIQSVFVGPQATHGGKIYGADWLNLGYKAGGQGVINVIINDLPGFFTADAREGRALESFSMMKDVRNLRDFGLLLAVASGRPGLKEWVLFGGDQADLPVAGGVTAVEAPLLYPYYPTQLLGLMGGLQGAAEYESALLRAYPHLQRHDRLLIRAATTKMGPQTVAHLLIVLFVVIGNIALFASRKETR
jgi:hypothetical protein